MEKANKQPEERQEETRSQGRTKEKPQAKDAGGQVACGP